jgi:hypothetical protein
MVTGHAVAPEWSQASAASLLSKAFASYRWLTQTVS